MVLLVLVSLMVFLPGIGGNPVVLGLGALIVVAYMVASALLERAYKRHMIEFTQVWLDRTDR